MGLQASVFSDTDVLAAINADRFPDGQEVTLEPVFGNSVTFDEEGNVVGAGAMMQVSHDTDCAAKCVNLSGDGMRIL